MYDGNILCGNILHFFLKTCKNCVSYGQYPHSSPIYLPSPLSFSSSRSLYSTLYNGSIIIGCSIYLLCELVMLVRKKIKMCPVWYLITAGVTGGISFLLFSRYSCLLCTEFGAWSVEVSAVPPQMG